MHNEASSRDVERQLTNLLPSEGLEDHAEDVGVVEREGKLQIPPLVWSFAFGFATGERRTLAAFRRSYNGTADESLSPGGFYQRLTPTLAGYLRDLVEYGFDEVAVPHIVSEEFDRREYAGAQSRDSKRFRVVVVRNEDDDYHLYITNLSREALLPEDLATIYRCRWEVELLFRELKTQYKLDEFDTTKKHIVELLLYAGLLSLIVSRDLLSLVIEHADDALVFPPERWAATFRSHAQLILSDLGEYLGYSPPPLLSD